VTAEDVPDLLTRPDNDDENEETKTTKEVSGANATIDCTSNTPALSEPGNLHSANTSEPLASSLILEEPPKLDNEFTVVVDLSTVRTVDEMNDLMFKISSFLVQDR